MEGASRMLNPVFGFQPKPTGAEDVIEAID